MTINTSKVTGRRKVHYDSFAEVLRDAEQLASGEVRTVGNWSYGQILEHLARGMEMAIEGFDFKAPLVFRLIAKVMKKRFLTNPMRAGFQLPKGMQHLLPEETSVADGLDHLRRSIARLEAETQRAPHPIFKNLTREESDQLQLRHCELHMSFVQPA